MKQDNKKHTVKLHAQEYLTPLPNVSDVKQEKLLLRQFFIVKVKTIPKTQKALKNMNDDIVDVIPNWIEFKKKRNILLES